MSFVEGVHTLGYVLDEERMLAAFALHLYDQEKVKGQTVVQYLCHLVNEYSFSGVKLDIARIDALKAAMMRRATPAIKANPMTHEQVIQFLDQPQLTEIKKTFVMVLLAQRTETWRTVSSGRRRSVSDFRGERRNSHGC